MTEVTRLSTLSAPSRSEDFYRDILTRLNAARAPYLVGGAYAFACLTGISRQTTKDLDLFVSGVTTAGAPSACCGRRAT